MTVLVTGARGRVGRAVLDGLRAAGVTDLRASGRDPSALDLPDGVAAVGFDLAAPDPAALAGVEQVFLYTGGDIAAVAEAAVAAGVEHVVLLSSSSVLGDDRAAGIGDHHRAAEATLVRSGLTVTRLRPGAFAANALRWAEDVRAGVVGLPCPDSHVTPIHERDIADVAVDALTGGPSRGAAPTLTGPASLSFREQVAELAAEVGHPVEVVAISADAYRASMRHAPPGVADTLLALWAAADGVPQPVDDVTPWLGRPGRPFAQWAHEHRDAFA